MELSIHARDIGHGGTGGRTIVDVLAWRNDRRTGMNQAADASPIVLHAQGVVALTIRRLKDRGCPCAVLARGGGGTVASHHLEHLLRWVEIGGLGKQGDGWG